MIDKAVHRGVMRFSILIIDLSSGIKIPDYKPTRAIVIKTYVEVRRYILTILYCIWLLHIIINIIYIYIYKEFIKDFFDQNPLSSLGIITCLDGKAKKVSNLSSNPIKHIEDFSASIKLAYGDGGMSLYNCLNLAKRMFENVPTYGNKEVNINVYFFFLDWKYSNFFFKK